MGLCKLCDGSSPHISAALSLCLNCIRSRPGEAREIAEIVKEVVPGCKIEFAPDAGPDKRCYRVDCNKIARVLKDFKPQWTARRGIEQLYEAYKKTGLTLEEFEGPQYKRIAHVKKLVNDGRLDKNLRWTKKFST